MFFIFNLGKKLCCEIFMKTRAVDSENLELENVRDPSNFVNLNDDGICCIRSASLKGKITFPSSEFSESRSKTRILFGNVKMILPRKKEVRKCFSLSASVF